MDKELDPPAGAALVAARQRKRPRRTLLRILGPGLITGASDDDPSAIATYSQVGAQFGHVLGWLMLFSYPLMAAIQEISARIGRVTGRGIAGNIRARHPDWLARLIGSAAYRSARRSAERSGWRAATVAMLLVSAVS